MRPKAFSYIRWSSPQQSLGSSLARQLERSRSYVAKNDLDLDESYRDEGLSAYRGKNRLEGSLGRFILKVESGDIPRGCFLLVESLDRISREGILEASGLFIKLIQAGINVVVITPYDADLFNRERFAERPNDLLMCLQDFYRANRESQRKGELVAGAWELKRGEIGTKKMTRLAPGWLTLNEDRTEFIVDAAKAATVRRIFQMLIDGLGKKSIVRILNDEAVPTFSIRKRKRPTTWNVSNIDDLLSKKAVLGLLQMRKTTTIEGDDGTEKVVVNVGEPVEGYYPAIIDEGTFNRAVSASRSRWTGVAGRKGTKFSNILVGMTKCSQCGGNMGYFHKRAHLKPYVICLKSDRHACTNRFKYDYRMIEAATLDFAFGDIDLTESRSDATRELESRVGLLTRRRDDLKTQVDNLAGQLALGVQAITDLLVSRNNDLKAVTAELEATKADLSATVQRPNLAARLGTIASMRAAMESENANEVYAVRAKINSAMRGLFDYVSFDEDGTVYVIILAGLKNLMIRPDGTTEIAEVIEPRSEVFTFRDPQREARFQRLVA